MGLEKGISHQIPEKQPFDPLEEPEETVPLKKSPKWLKPAIKTLSDQEESVMHLQRAFNQYMGDSHPDFRSSCNNLQALIDIPMVLNKKMYCQYKDLLADVEHSTPEELADELYKISLYVPEPREVYLVSINSILRSIDCRILSAPNLGIPDEPKPPTMS